MALPKLKPEFDIDAYMAWEEDQPERHEYLGGEVFAMSGGTDAHYTILLNTATSLKVALSGKPCRAFLSGMKLRIPTIVTAHTDERDRCSVRASVVFRV